MKRGIIGLFFAFSLVNADFRDSNPIAEKNNEFAFALYEEVAGVNDGNLFFSPYSISTAFAMCYGGSAGSTEEEMGQAMCFPANTADFHHEYGAYNRLLEENARGNIELNVANRLWGEKDYRFVQDYLDLVEDAYHAPLQEANFKGNPDGERQGINQWVEDQTNDRIKNLLPPGSVSSDTRLVLANAIYFKGDWLYPFDEKKTKDKTFHQADGGETRVPFMYYEGGLKYFENEKYQIAQLPYKGNKQSMVVVLPKIGVEMSDVEESMNTNIFYNILYAGQPEVILEMPKFKMTQSLGLNNYMKKLGMEKAFEQGANFSKMTESNDLFISAALHKAFIEIDETGTEAAAATAIVMVAESASYEKPKPIRFIADRPFLFYIIDNQTQSILFMGRVVEVA